MPIVRAPNKITAENRKICSNTLGLPFWNLKKRPAFKKTDFAYYISCTVFHFYSTSASLESEMKSRRSRDNFFVMLNSQLPIPTHLWLQQAIWLYIFNNNNNKNQSCGTWHKFEQYTGNCEDRFSCFNSQLKKKEKMSQTYDSHSHLVKKKNGILAIVLYNFLCLR
jgi:hypothetical protein